MPERGWLWAPHLSQGLGAASETVAFSYLPGLPMGMSTFYNTVSTSTHTPTHIQHLHMPSLTEKLQENAN